MSQSSTSADRPEIERRFASVAIVGMGLIGSSVARALRASQPGARLKGYDQQATVREQVRQLGLVDEVAASAAEAASGSELVILCVPVGTSEAVARSLGPALGASAIVTDVGSSKSLVAARLRRVLPGARLVPAHPIAGSDRSGPDAGSAELFRDRWCILTPDEHARTEDVESISAFWRSLGARVEIMSAEQHDLVLAAISHVPHLLAFASMAAVAALEEEHGHDFTRFAAGGFRDFTRLAAANPQVWKDIFLSNKVAIRGVSTVFRSMSEQLERLVEADDEEALLRALGNAQRTRLAMSPVG